MKSDINLLKILNFNMKLQITNILIILIKVLCDDENEILINLLKYFL